MLKLIASDNSSENWLHVSNINFYVIAFIPDFDTFEPILKYLIPELPFAIRTITNIDQNPVWQEKVVEKGFDGDGDSIIIWQFYVLLRIGKEKIKIVNHNILNRKKMRKKTIYFGKNTGVNSSLGSSEVIEAFVISYAIRVWRIEHCFS